MPFKTSYYKRKIRYFNKNITGKPVIPVNQTLIDKNYGYSINTNNGK